VHLLLCLVIVLPLSSARSLSLLSLSSLLGLIALALAFLLILFTGLWRGEWRAVDPSLLLSYLWPDSMQVRHPYSPSLSCVHISL
jgi:amino acid permease